jgi:hypothetical protein
MKSINANNYDDMLAYTGLTTSIAALNYHGWNICKQLYKNIYVKNGEKFICPHGSNFSKKQHLDNVKANSVYLLPAALSVLTSICLLPINNSNLLKIRKLLGSIGLPLSAYLIFLLKNKADNYTKLAKNKNSKSNPTKECMEHASRNAKMFIIPAILYGIVSGRLILKD